MAFFRPAPLIVLAVVSAASSGAHAVGFGRVTPSAVLGQPLNLQIPVLLDQGEQLFAECVKAEVSAGESVLVPSQVRVSVAPTGNPAEWIARITTTVPILEPVVEVAVSAGCERRFMRRFTAFVDPPVMSLTAPVLAQAPLLERPLAARGTEAAGSGRRSAEAPSRSRTSVRRERNERQDHPATAPRRAAVAEAAPKLGAAATASARRASPEQREAQVARLLLDVGGPRLRMDIEEPVFMPAGTAASGAAGEAALADIDRLQLLEKTLAGLKKETASYRQNEVALKSRLAEAESRSRLLPWLLGLLALSLGVAGWAVWRQRQRTGRPEAAGTVAPGAESVASPWWGGSSAAAPVPAPAPEPGLSGALLVSELEPPEPSTPLASYEKTQPFTGSMAAAAQASIADGQLPAREVSVEELLDLEQQADFFIALGQEDAAVDLLMAHLRGTGGQSPLPYTKLLEIYRRQGDRSAYERIRARFNRRFNAYAPDWDQGPLHGRSLEDYPDVVLRLQEMWSSPLNAMAVLEAMLFRNDEQQDLFDLPAYKDVLLLYSLARDLYQQDGVSAEDVDLLLPLGDEAAFAPSGMPASAADPLAEPPGLHAYDLTSFSLDTPSGAGSSKH